MQRYWIVVLVLGLWVGIGSAQGDKTETLLMGGGHVITVPVEWQFSHDTGNGFFWETNDSIIRIRHYDLFSQASFEISDLNGLLDLLVVIAFGEPEIDESAIKPLDFGAYTGIEYAYEASSEGEGFTRLIQAYMADNGFFYAGYIRPISGYDLNQEDVLAMQTALMTITVQDSYRMHEGTQYQIPDGWQLTGDYNGVYGLSSVSNGELDIELTLWTGFGAVLGFDQFGAVLTYFSDGYTFVGFPDMINDEDLHPVWYAGIEGVRYTQYSGIPNDRGTFSRMLMQFNLQNNSIIVVSVSSLYADSNLDPIGDILNTLVAGTDVVCGLYAEAGTPIYTHPSTDAEIVRTTDEEDLIAMARQQNDALIWFEVAGGYVNTDDVDHDYNSCLPLPLIVTN